MDTGSMTTKAPPLARPHPPTDHPPQHEGNGQGHAKPAAEHDAVDLNVSHPRAGWIVVVGIVAVILMAVLLVIGTVPRLSVNHDLAADADAALHAPIPVTVVTARKSDAVIKVPLPGTLRPWQEVSIFARSTGYLKGFYVDISNQIKVGTLMAEILTPEVDQQLEAAKANVELAKAASAKSKTDMDYAKLTDDRYEQLRGSSGVTQQELDQYKAQYNSAVATYHQAEAQVGVAEANVRQLSEMQSFEKIYAPFSGVVTGRAYDVGAFIIANPTASDITPMFKLARNDVLRAFVNVPQSSALQVKMGMKVAVTSRERAGRTYEGTVLGTTNYLDPTARSLLTEVRIENPDLSLLPGMFVDTNFEITRDHPPLIIPAPALVINADGNQVAIVRDKKAHFQKVTLGVDFGNDIEILSGLNGDEQIIGNPGEKIVEGAEVKASAPTTAPAPK